MANDEIQEQVMSLFDQLVKDLPHSEYLEVVENIASDFESRYDAAREEADNMEDDDQ